MVDTLKSNPLFDLNSNPGYQTFQEERKQTMLRTRALGEIDEFAIGTFISNYTHLAANMEVLYSWDPSTALNIGIKLALFSNAIKTQGTAEHMYLAEASDNNEVKMLNLG